ncbi:RNA polymerase sigma-70 factor (ECF subfamily) [Inquilinus ginsengisoli]|uniref:RNA polymerase sigma-70 factor (ECF subfamily) n=1 Tax=Inquilinus ginsengisoli TaxID=363840 RepID=A0ABU1JVN0_9PROT|nr:RNA polymerase sigma factor [Inquilinus ginsengisoli]MDR6292668.1 RNA polymerase sigma-70 factor (ECF subfamily) [Inquilinus ginsengisoli]
MTAISAATERQFLQIVAPCIPDLRRYARSLTRNSADTDDLVQETMVRAALKLHLWQPGTNIMAWLVVMMRRLHLSQNVVGKRNQAIMVPIDDWDAVTPPSQTQAVELREIAARWPELSAIHRDVLEAVAVGGESYEQAAERFQVPVGTIRSRLARARLSLREAVATAH